MSSALGRDTARVGRADGERRRGPGISVRARTGVAMTLALLAAGSASGQQAPIDEADLLRRIDSLAVVHRHADSVADIADALRRLARGPGATGPGTDTMRVGPFLLVAPESQAREARVRFERAWSVYDAFVGSGRTPLDGRYFTFQSRQPYRNLGVDGIEITTRAMAARFLDDRIAQALGHALAIDIPSDLRSWLGGDFSLRVDARKELERTYRALATTPSTAVASCFEGSAEACWDAVGLAHRDTWWTTWYDGSERAALLAKQAGPRDDRELLDAACGSGPPDEACRTLLSRLEPSPWIPLTAPARTTLVRQALSLGGRGSLQRLFADGPVSVRDRLAVAAGVDPDTLIASWRATVLAAPPNLPAHTRRSGWTSLLWLLALTIISTRSTRWRLG